MTRNKFGDSGIYVPGHNPSRWKNYDVVNCYNCNGVMKIPKTDDTIVCPHCGVENTFGFAVEMPEEPDV